MTLSLYSREKQRKQREKGYQNRGPAWTPGGQFAPKPLIGDRNDQRVTNVRQEAAEMRVRVS